MDSLEQMKTASGELSIPWDPLQGEAAFVTKHMAAASKSESGDGELDRLPQSTRQAQMTLAK